MRWAHLRRDRGATLIEFALVLPILLLLAYGTAELGLAWTAENRVQGAVAQAARVGASNGATRESDRDILLSLKVTLEPNVLQRVERVVVFSATDANGQVPSICRNTTGDVGNAANRCNSYSGATVRALAANGSNAATLGFSTTTSNNCSTSRIDRYWCATARHDSLADPPDWLGVWVKTTYPNPVPTFFGDFQLERTSIFRIQPDFTG